jgi:hypothetical protein
VYLNPLLTASSGNVIRDIHSLMHLFTSVSVPTPFSFLKGLFQGKDNMNWLTLSRVWSEVGEVLESDVFGGNIISSVPLYCRLWLNKFVRWA